MSNLGHMGSKPENKVKLVKSDVVFAAVLSVFLVGGWYFLFGDIDLNLTDEGYLWYGAQQTASGAVPIRDFQSYSPGRYYWCAAWSFVLGEGILALRLSVRIFQIFGLWCGLLAVRRVVYNRWFLIPIGLVLILWMFPRYKLFEASLALMAVFLAVRLLEKPSPRLYFGAGVFVSLSSFFGLNVGLYCALGFVSLVVFLHWKLRQGDLLRKLAIWTGGFAVGQLPMLGLIAIVPRFGTSLWDSVLDLLRHRSTNLPLPIPWPWRIDYTGLDWQAAVVHFLTGVAFLLPPIIYATSATMAWRTKPQDVPQRALLLATSTIGIFFFHHASVRSDIYHLAPSIHPALLGAFALLATLRLGRRPVATLALCAGLLFTGKVIVPNTESWGSWVRPKPYLVSYRVGGDTLQLPRTQANYLRWLESTIRQNLEPEENILILPVFVTLYPLLGKESPIRGLYLTRPASNEEQAEIIRSLEEKGVNWALIINLKIDGREDLLFESTHPLVWEYLEKGFRRHLVPEISPPHIFYQRRGFSQSDPVRVAPATLSRSLGSSLPSAMLTARK